MTLTGLPAFFVDVPAGVKALVGVSVLITVVAVALMFSGRRPGSGGRLMIAVVTILLAFPLGYFVRSRLAASTAYAIAYLWAFVFQGIYLMLDMLDGGKNPAFEPDTFPLGLRRRHAGDLRGRLRAGEPRSLAEGALVAHRHQREREQREHRGQREHRARSPRA